MKNIYLLQLDVDKGTDLFVCIDGLMNDMYSRNRSYIKFDSKEEAEAYWNKNSWMLDEYDEAYKSVKSASVVEVSFKECIQLSAPMHVKDDFDR